MLDEHLMNPQEFWGAWVIPATPKNEAAYLDQQDWRGQSLATCIHRARWLGSQM